MFVNGVNPCSVVCEEPFFSSQCIFSIPPPESLLMVFLPFSRNFPPNDDGEATKGKGNARGILKAHPTRKQNDGGVRVVVGLKGILKAHPTRKQNDGGVRVVVG